MSEIQVKQVRLIKGTEAQIQAHASDILPTDIVIRTDAPELATLSALQTETTNRENADGALEQSIREEEDRATTAEGNLNTAIEAEESERISSDEALQLAIGVINGKIPAQATSSNQLADKEFVNSSIATNTANFIGTFDSLEELEAYTGTKTNNDYAFVIGQDSEGNTEYNRYKWTTAETPNAWKYEFTLNNSSFTAEQWAAISSKITASKVEAYDEHIADTDIHVTTTDKANWNGKQDAISDLSTIRSNAQAGKNAKDTIDTYGDVVTHNASEFATSSQGSKADTALQPNDDISKLNNNVGYQTEQQVNTAISNHNQDAESHSDIRADIDELDERIDEIQLFKFPNAIIRGEPTIQNGQISDFSVVSYLQFPFLIDFQDNAFQIDFCFTTSTNVQTQQNIIDSNFGIALAIANGKGLMAISSNGTSWNIGSAVGTINIQPNTTYYARLTWNKLQYKTFLSTDGINYTQDMVLVGATRPYPRTAFIGGCNQEETGHTPHPFLGTINMNKAFLYVNNQLIWQGMDDAGLATRADISLSNLDADGEARFAAKLDAPTTGAEGQYLQKTADGVQWNTVDALPSQAGQSGKFLKTDGTSASWDTVVSTTITYWE